MLRFLLLLLLLLNLAGAAAAQTFIIELPPKAQLPAASGFRVEQVVDARADRTVLGYVQQGLDNHRVPANFRQSLSAEVLAFLQAQPVRPDARPVLLRIHTLRLAEETRASSERANAEIMADFLLRDGAQYYPLLSVGLGTESKGLDVTKQHSGNLAKLLTDCLGQLAALPTTQPPAPAAPLTLTQVQQGAGYQPYLFPIQRAATPRRGFYRTLQEFQNDSPSPETEPFEIVQKPRAGKLWAGQPAIDAYLLKPSFNGARTPVRGIWGLSDGQHLYIFQRGSYFPLTPAGTAYTFTGFAPVDPNDALTGVVLGSMFGVVGGVAAAAMAGSSGPLPYEMSVLTGNLVAQRSEEGFAAAADTAAVYLYRRAATSAGPPVQVLVDGQAAGTLGPEQYLALTWRDRRRDLTICVQDGQPTCYTFLPVFGTATYLTYARKKADDQPTLQPVPAKEGAFQLRHLKLRAKP